jgi:methyl-accepting chemotaxis protein
MGFISNLSLRMKIILPLTMVSVILAGAIYIYFSDLYTQARTEELMTKARAVLYSAESAREYGGEQHRAQIFKDFTQSAEFKAMTEEQKRAKVLYTVPVFAAMQVAEKKSAELGFTFKAPRSDGQRNPENKPNEFEESVLAKLTSGEKEIAITDEKENKLRFFRPVRLTSECLTCQGDPATSATGDGKDILGFKMEGKKAGDMHGAFEVIMPLEALQADVKSKSIIIALIALAGMLGTILVGYLVARMISNPVDKLNQAAQKVTEGNTDIAVQITSNDELGRLGLAFNTMTGSIRSASQQQQALNDYLNASINEILAGMDKFSQGDLTVQLQAKSNDAIGRLYEGFNKSVYNVKSMLTQVIDIVENTAAGASQISSATEQLAAGSQEQSSQTSEVAAAVEQMTSTILDNARTATNTADLARHSGESAQHGGMVVEQMVNKISDIAEVMKHSSDTVTRLGVSSTQIGEIVSVINDIADQTNLLALNAAIEAARAGDQGRGFAVVADEVRKLAERTTQATKQIASMIKGIQSETTEAVSMMKKGNEEVTEGLHLAERSGSALHEIVKATQELVGMIGQIAAAAEEQSSTSEQMARNVDGISHVAADSAKAISDIAHTATSLSSQTEMLRNLVEQFRVDDESHLVNGKSSKGAYLMNTSNRSKHRLNAAN